MKILLLCLSLLMCNINEMPQFSEVVSSLIPGGENIGVEIKAKGVVVVGSYDVVNETEKYNPGKDSDILKGDLIYQINGEDINNVEDLLAKIKKYIQNDSVQLSIMRNQNKVTKELKLIKTSKANTLKTGLLVKERLLGIGTMTFYDPQTKIYGALGHKLIDSDFSSIVDIHSGNIYESSVNGIHPSKMGNVGELLSTIYEDKQIGTVFKNTEYGVFGYYQTCPDKDALQVASKDEVKLGKAYIYTTLSGQEVKKYEIKITSLAKQDKISTKGISFKVVDKDLLSQTGGIVQGMSGSPIIQDDKIVGAVTHVLVDSVKKGYGIYIDFMLEAAKNG